jgi:hypothetical protein
MAGLFSGFKNALFGQPKSVEEIEADIRRNMLYDSFCDCDHEGCDDCFDDDYDYDDYDDYDD